MALTASLILAAGASLIATGVYYVRRPVVGRIKNASTGIPAGWMPVLDADELIRKNGIDGLLNSIRAKIGLNKQNYQHDCLATLDRFFEYVQMLPASESHHHAQPGGMIVHALETADIALSLRRKHILPPDAAPEDILRLEHRWTFGVFLAAIAHDVGKAMADLRIAYRTDKEQGNWSPLAGSLNQYGAIVYQVNFTPPAERDYQAHQKLPVVLMQRIVPQSTMAWLAEDNRLVQEIMNCLSGNYDGPVGKLVQEADRLSVANNLKTGPRTRFRTARAVPVIERLMEALRRMLQEGGVLPLNRSGGAGWVFEGHIWFVSKRVADEVRDYLRRNESGAGIPGDDKNDRLFDIWQEYGALVENPATGGAIWRARIEGEGYSHDFTMLRFPLSALYVHADHYPPPMKGRVVVQDAEWAASEAVIESKNVTDAVLDANSRPSAEPVSPPVSTATSRPNAPALPANTSTSQRTVLLPPMKTAPASDLPELRAAPTELVRRAPTLSESAPSEMLPNDDYLDDEETPHTASPRLSAPDLTPPTPIRGAVMPMNPRPATQAEKLAPEAAKRFMAWIQRGLADGSLAYNETGAMVHFVAAGMMLVSPRVFREFAALYGEAGDGTPSVHTDDKLGSGIQREVIRASWHIYGPKKLNVLKYQVLRRNGTPGVVLTGMVIRNPERFVNPVPPVNSMLLPLAIEHSHEVPPAKRTGT